MKKHTKTVPESITLKTLHAQCTHNCEITHLISFLANSKKTQFKIIHLVSITIDLNDTYSLGRIPRHIRGILDMITTGEEPFEKRKVYK